MFEEKDIRHVETSNGDDLNEKTENIMFTWGIDGFGFGTTTFFYKDGKLKCDNEAMSKESIKKIMCKFVDNAEFVGWIIAELFQEIDDLNKKTGITAKTDQSISFKERLNNNAEDFDSIVSELLKKVDTLKDKNRTIKRLTSALQYEFPDKYPDNCTICHGDNGGVRGNENIIDGIVMCDYCNSERTDK